MAEIAQLFFESLSSAAAVTAVVGRAEDLYFEGKTCSVPFSAQDQNHLAEALSGFANSDGGVLIYGLVAKGGNRSTPDVITNVKLVENLHGLQAEALSLVGQLVEPPVPGVRIEIRPIDRLPDSGFLLIYVPASEMAHRSRKDREFYRRHGTGFYRMEYFEIAEIFGRRRRPILSVSAKFRQFSVSGGITYGARLVISLANEGRGIAKFPGLLLRESRACLYGVDGNGKFGLSPRPTSNGRNLLYGGGADDVIHTQASLEVTMIEVNVATKDNRVVVTQPPIDYELYAEDMATIKGKLDFTGHELKDL